VSDISFNAGAIESRLEIDLTPFQRGVREARREMEELGRMRPRIILGADTDEWDEAYRRVQEEARRLAERSYRMRVGMDRSEFRRGADEVRREMERLNQTEARPKVKDNGFKAALASVFKLRDAILLLSPVAIPVMIAITGAALTMGAAFITAGAGIGIFAAAAKQQLTPVLEAHKKLAAARVAYDKATTKKAKDTALANQASALQGLTTHQLRAVAAIDRLKQSWENFGHTAQKPMLDIFLSGVRILIRLMKVFEPVILPVTLAIKGWMGTLENFVNGPSPKKFASFLGREAPFAINIIIASLKDFAIGIKNIFVAFNGGSGSFLLGLRNAADSFRRWTVSPAITKFVELFHKSGPGVGSALMNIATSIMRIVVALGPVGGLLLKTIVPLAAGLAYAAEKAPWLVQGLWALFAVMKALAIIQAVTAALKSFWLVMTGAKAAAIMYGVALWTVKGIMLAWAAACWVANAAMTAAKFVWMLLNLAFAASPIGLIVIAIIALGAALVLAYMKVGWFRKGVDALFGWLKTATLFVINFIKQHWQLIIAIMLGPLGIMIGLVIKNWTRLKNFVTSGVTTIINFVRDHWRLIISIIGGPLGIAISLVTKHWGTIKRVTTSMIGAVLGKIKEGMTATRNAFSNGAEAAGRAFSKIREATKKPVNFVIGTVYNNGIRRLWNTVTGWLHLSGLSLGEVPMLARGGPIPAHQAGWVNSPTAVVGEGSKTHPEVVIPTDPKYRARAQALWTSAGGKIQMLAKGGFLGGGWDWVKKAAGKVKDVAKAGLDFLTNPGAIFDRLAKSMVPGAGGLATSPWGQAISQIPPKMLGEVKRSIIGMAKQFNAGYGGDSSGVIKAALSYLGQGDDRGHDNDNIFTRMFGMPAGTPWCALFISAAIKKANAGKHYPGYPTAAVAGFNGAMRHVPVNEGRPGDLATYGSNSHINLIIKRAGTMGVGPSGGSSTYDTVGGNQGPVVNRYVRGGAATVLRPMARGGVLGNDMRQVLAMRNPDPHDTKNPLLAMMRKSFGVYDDGGDMRPGLTVGWNGTGKVESTVTSEWREQVMRDLAEIKAVRGRDINVNATFRHPVDPYTAAREITNDVMEAV
jgi:hypothetical protein